MKHVAIIGTGTMAAGIAAGFISHSVPIAILGRDQEKSRSCIKKAIALAQKIGLNGVNALMAIEEVESLQITRDLALRHDWNQCQFIIESVSENIVLKKKIFGDLDQQVPSHIPIGSNSSGFPISKIAEGLNTANRMLGAHYFMPAEVVPLVEVVLGNKTEMHFAEKVSALYRLIQKKPVLVKKDIPGFLANRIQHALMREALSLVEAVGPMTQKEISGWDGMANAAKEIYPSLSNITTLPSKLNALMENGKTGMKAGEGFRKWTPDEIQKTTESYSKRLKAAFDVLNMQ